MGASMRACVPACVRTCVGRSVGEWVNGYERAHIRACVSFSSYNILYESLNNIFFFSCRYTSPHHCRTQALHFPRHCRTQALHFPPPLQNTGGGTAVNSLVCKALVGEGIICCIVWGSSPKSHSISASWLTPDSASCPCSDYF